MKHRTWKVLDWSSRPEKAADGDAIPLMCPCGHDAMMPTAGYPGCLIIGVVGMGLILDPPGATVVPGFMPDEVQCRRCRKIFGYTPVEREVAGVR